MKYIKYYKSHAIKASVALSIYSINCGCLMGNENKNENKKTVKTNTPSINPDLPPNPSLAPINADRDSRNIIAPNDNPKTCQFVSKVDTGKNLNSNGTNSKIGNDDFELLMSALNNSRYIDKNLLTDDISKKDLNIKTLILKEDEFNLVVKPESVKKSVKKVMYKAIYEIDYYITDGFRKIPVYKKELIPV